MSMIRKSISVTDQQADWIRTQIDAGPHDSASEVIRELIRERQMQERETPEEIEAIRAALMAGEESVKRDGYSRKSMGEIWEEAKAIHRQHHG